ncbi:MAG TPA: hypothetical protein VOB72_14125 [Candidatus Dormibacteraeota bacterium]|nr:hypothetical protein [Candidatus Dormibacteraeota bacterium]
MSFAMTRRATLRLIGGGVAGAALAAAGGLTRALAFTATVAETAAEPLPVVPAGGAGLFDVDPAQPALSQVAGSVVTGDVAALPVGMEL